MTVESFNLETPEERIRRLEVALRWCLYGRGEAGTKAAMLVLSGADTDADIQTLEEDL